MMGGPYSLQREPTSKQGSQRRSPQSSDKVYPVRVLGKAQAGASDALTFPSRRRAPAAKSKVERASGGAPGSPPRREQAGEPSGAEAPPDLRGTGTSCPRWLLPWKRGQIGNKPQL